MRVFLQMAPHLIHGTRQERARALADIGIRFATGAYLVSVLIYFLDPVTANLGSNGYAAIGGLITVLITAIKTA